MKIFRCVLLLMILFAATTYAESKPVRIARLPIIFHSTIPDVETRAELETKIERAIHIPLNGTLQLAEYLPQENSSQVLEGIWQKLSAENKRAKLADAMRPLAQELDADIIVCPIINQYSQNVVFAWDETVLNSYVQVELIVYDRRADNLIDKKAAQMYHDAYSLRGTASALSKICFDNVTDKTKLRQLIRDIRN